MPYCLSFFIASALPSLSCLLFTFDSFCSCLCRALDKNILI